jgi:hypothetical protein
MKKILAVFTLLVAFSINANAQSKSTVVQSKKALTSKEKGAKDANDLTALVRLNETQNAELVQLFEQKYSASENLTLSEERKDALAKYMDSQLRSTLTEKQMKKLDGNPELLKQLTR